MHPHVFPELNIRLTVYEISLRFAERFHNLRIAWNYRFICFTNNDKNSSPFFLKISVF